MSYQSPIFGRACGTGELDLQTHEYIAARVDQLRREAAACAGQVADRDAEWLVSADRALRGADHRRLRRVARAGAFNDVSLTSHTHHAPAGGMTAGCLLCSAGDVVGSGPDEVGSRRHPGTEEWRLSLHAWGRLRQMRMDHRDVFRAVGDPEMHYPSPPGYPPGRSVFVRGEACVVVHDAALEIVTVLWNGGEVDPRDPNRPRLEAKP